MTNGSMVRAACATSIPVVSTHSACPSRKASAATFRRRTLSCRATATDGRGDDNNDGLLWVPRRDMMLSGLSGVAAGLAWYPGVASGAADAPPKCAIADKVSDKSVKCTDPAEGSPPCPWEPSTPTEPIDFTPASKVTRVRQPVHRLSRENREKYKEAVAKMKALEVSEPTNPLRFAAQAAIHEAYCDAHYRYEATGGERPFDVHSSWIFAPWHRMYIYFYERALGDLIGDDTFALPYWSWDDPAGMVVPPLFKDSVGNPLYDANRNPDNLDALVDLEYLSHRGDARIPFKGPQNQDYKALVNRNLCTVYRQQVGLSPESFLGGKFCTEGSKTAGTLEQMAHIAMHVWVGKAGPPTGTDCNAETGVPSHIDPKTPFNCSNDMGFLGAAGRDPLFYSHHSNVDRMWHLWSTRLGGGQGFADDADWLGTSFVFYDDVKSPRKVRIKFSDVLDTRNLGYTYDAEFDRDLQWLRPKIVSLVPHGKDAPPKAKTRALLKSAAPPVFPLALTKGQVVELTDLAVPAKQPGKELLLVIDGVEYDPQAPNKFDVAINVPKDKALEVGPQYKEYAGSFAVVPGTGAGKTQQTKVSLCITQVLFDIDAEDDKTVDVVIVPRTDAKVTLNASPTIQYRN